MPEGQAGALEITPAMIEAGVSAFYRERPDVNVSPATMHEILAVVVSIVLRVPDPLPTSLARS